MKLSKFFSALLLIFTLFFSISLFTPSFALALDGDTQDPNPGGGSTSSEPDVSFQLENPLSGVSTISEFVKKILDVVLTIGIPIVALAIIYSGFLFVAARGNTEKLSQAKKTFLYTIIGAAVLLGAWLLAQVLSETITQLSA